MLIKSPNRYIMSSSRRVSNKKEVKQTRCGHCEKIGMPRHVVENHNVRDRAGRVCCPAILGNTCSKCDERGHLPSYCNGVKKVYKFKPFRTEARVEKLEVKPVAADGGAFAALGDSEDETPAPSTPRRFNTEVKSSPPPLNHKNALSKIDWFADVSDDEEDAPPANVTVRKREVKREDAW